MKRKFRYVICLCFAIFCFSIIYVQYINTDYISKKSELKIERHEYKEQDIEIGMDIHIIYPQISSEQVLDKLLEINNILYDKFIPEFEEGLFYESDFEIKTNNSGIISIVSKGDFYVQGSAYPMSFFNTVNINPSQLLLIEFNDLNISDKLISANEKECLSIVKGVNDVLEAYPYSKLIKMFMEQSEKPFYLTNYDIGIVIYLNHVSGDYVILESTCDIMK